MNQKIKLSSLHFIATLCLKTKCIIRPTLLLISLIFCPQIGITPFTSARLPYGFPELGCVTSDQCFCILIQQSLVQNKLQAAEK